MSRKRQLKKERSQVEELDRQLQDLHRQGAGREILELVHGRVRGPLSAATADLYGEAVDRTLRRALAGGDLAQLGHLVPRVHRDAAARPWVRVAGVVADLADGRLDRLEKAQAGLGALSPPLSPRTVEALSALCAPDLGGMAAVERLYRALTALDGRGSPPEAGERAALEKAFGALHPVLDADAEAQRLLDAGLGCLRRLAELEDLERSLSEEESGDAVRDLFLEAVRRLAGPLLEDLRSSAPLLRPLRHALRLRWRAVLILAKERGGEEAWVAVLGVAPALGVLDLEVASDAARGLGRLGQRETLLSLLAGEEHRDLARHLRSAGRSEDVPERLARLWSLELWALDRAAEAAVEDDAEGSLPEPPHHAVLVRLAAMAGEVAQRFPAEQRAEVARFLTERLLDLAEALFSCTHFRDAAAALLQHLPDDPVLLVLGVTAAVSQRDGRALERFGSLVLARGPVSGDRERLLRLFAGHVAQETPPNLSRILVLLRPLFPPEAWPEVLSVVAREAACFIASTLRLGVSKAVQELLLRELRELRTSLPEWAELPVLEAAVGCLCSVSGAPQELRRRLSAAPDLETALLALRVLAAPPAGHLLSQPVQDALQETRETVIDRLDARWWLWKPLLPELVIEAGKGTVRRLRQRVRRILRRENPGAEDRQALEQVFGEIEMMLRFGGMLGFLWKQEPQDPEDAPPRPRGRRRRRAGEDQQVELDLF